jgi:outer membrane protein assembly factor BamA
LRLFRAGLTALVFALAAGVLAEEDGPRWTAVAVEGNRALADEDLLGALPFKTGDPFRPEQIEPARRMLLGHCQTRGYLEAEVSASTAAAPGGAAAVFRVNEGPLYSFGDVRFDGFEKVSASAAARAVTVRRGRPYDRRELFRTQAALYGLGVFEDVEIRTSTSPARTADVSVRVREQPLKWVRGGVGYGSEEK